MKITEEPRPKDGKVVLINYLAFEYGDGGWAQSRHIEPHPRQGVVERRIRNRLNELRAMGHASVIRLVRAETRVVAQWSVEHEKEESQKG